MNGLKLLEGMPESLFFAIDGKILKFPSIRLDIRKQGGNRLFWTTLDLSKSNFSLGKKSNIYN